MTLRLIIFSITVSIIFLSLKPQQGILLNFIEPPPSVEPAPVAVPLWVTVQVVKEYHRCQ